MQRWDFLLSQNFFGYFLAVSSAVLGFLQLLFPPTCFPSLGFSAVRVFSPRFSGRGSAKAQSRLCPRQLLSAGEGGEPQSPGCRRGHDARSRLLPAPIVPFPPLHGCVLFFRCIYEVTEGKKEGKKTREKVLKTRVLAQQQKGGIW